MRPRHDQVRYRAMSPADLPYVVAEHRHHFPDGFFARLGPRFLTEYYRAFLTGPSTRTIVADQDGEPVGYLVGVTDPAAQRAHVVQQHGRRLMARAAAAMLVRPFLAALFLRTRGCLYARKLLRRRSDGRAVEVPCPRAAVLSHVAIADRAQSAGIGSALVRWFEQQAAAAGCERLVLVTVSGEDGAAGYYRRRGWKAAGERCTPDGRWLTTFERTVRPQASGREPKRSADTA